MTYQHQDFPAWRYGPEGKAAVFESESDVPRGWQDHPSKVGGKSAAAPAAAKTPAAAKAPPTPAASATDNPGDLDADGHPYDAKLHAGTGSKTKAGLWRMKVGVARPAAAPGYPKAAPPLDL
jgi:hypothetical protein